MRRDTEYQYRWRGPSTAVRQQTIIDQNCGGKVQDEASKKRTRSNNVERGHSRPCHRVSHPLGASDRGQQATQSPSGNERGSLRLLDVEIALRRSRCRPRLNACDRHLPGRLLPSCLQSEAGRLIAQLSQTMAPDNTLPPSRTNQSNGSNPRSRLSCQTWGMLKRAR
jgi:hypothetical protein